MTCPHCGAVKTYIIDKRPRDLYVVWRRRECKLCGIRFSTLEKVYRIGKEKTGNRSVTKQGGDSNGK